jgi:8-oxo-dGTP pyrophosphatase MutT (NUDIX family)
MVANASEFVLVSPISGGFRLTFGDVAVDRVRCVLRHRGKFLLADHGSGRRGKRPKWGLPGGRVLPNEQPVDGIKRELSEELRLHVPNVVELGDWWHREENYRLFGTDVIRGVRWFDVRELNAVVWLRPSEVAKLAARKELHKGFELAAIAEFQRRFPV